MIKGKVKENLNEFESEIEILLGRQHEQTGYIYYFDLLHETFLRATKHLVIDSQQFNKDLVNEDRENIHSLIQSYESVSNPLIETLYKSYFITVHSELEVILSEVKDIVKKHFNNSTFPKKTTQSFFKPFLEEQQNTIPFIRETILNHQILPTYTYIRNGLIHPKNCKESDEYKQLENDIEQGKINYLEIVENKNGFIFLIKDIDFVQNYSREVILFFQDIIDNSVKYRK